MGNDNFVLTPEGRAKLEEELHYLETEKRLTDLPRSSSICSAKKTCTRAKTTSSVAAAPAMRRVREPLHPYYQQI